VKRQPDKLVDTSVDAFSQGSVNLSLSGIGARIKAARKAIGMTQDTLARMAGATSNRGLQDNEAGKSMPGSQMIGALVAAGINANWLLTGEGQMRLADLAPPPAAPVQEQGQNQRSLAAPGQEPPQIESYGPAAEPMRFYGVAEPGPAPAKGPAEIDAHLLWLCHDACLQVYGDDFAREKVHLQIDHAADLYNLLLRLSAARPPKSGARTDDRRASSEDSRARADDSRARADDSRSSAEDFRRLDAEEMASQLRLLVQLKWVKPYPPPPTVRKQLIF
jgi:transcriptional regulator with XRE-family HTH domain